MEKTIRIVLIVIFAFSLALSLSGRAVAKGKPDRECLVTCPDKPGKGNNKPITPPHYGGKPITPPGKNK
jgi:hypothetical protein